MTGRDYRSCAARIRQELLELDGVARRACRAWASVSGDPDDHYVDAAAPNAHGSFAGLEGIFTLVAERIDGPLPVGPNRHQELLLQTTVEMPGVRHAILSPHLFPRSTGAATVDLGAPLAPRPPRLSPRRTAGGERPPGGTCPSARAAAAAAAVGAAAAG